MLEKSILAIIRLKFTFSTIFLVNNGPRAIKVHVNKVQYCRAGHIFVTSQGERMLRDMGVQYSKSEKL